MSQYPVVLLHAFPLSSRMFQPLHAQLAASDTGVSDLTLYTPDLPGFGGREVPAADPSLRVYVDDLADQISALGFHKIILGGVSMGGYITMEFLRWYPQLVAGLVLANTKASADTAAAAQGRAELADRVLTEGTGFLRDTLLPKMVAAELDDSSSELLQGMFQDADPAAVAWASHAMARRDEQFAVLQESGLPALIIAGASDQLTTVQDAQQMQEALPSSQLHILPETGHLSPLEQPKQFAHLLTQFATNLDK